MSYSKAFLFYIAVAAVAAGCQTKIDVKQSPTEQVLSDLQKNYGAFARIDTNQRMISCQYIFPLPDGYVKSRDIKDLINQRLNLQPVQSHEKPQVIGTVTTVSAHKWETPDFKIDMNSNMKGQDSLRVLLWFEK